MGKSVKFAGLNELRKALNQKQNLDEVHTVVRKNGAALQTKAQRKAPVDTGTLKRSIGRDFSNDGLTVTVEPTAHYAPYVEWGTRYMEAQPFVKPAFNDQKDRFVKDLEKLVR